MHIIPPIFGIEHFQISSMLYRFYMLLMNLGFPRGSGCTSQSLRLLLSKSLLSLQIGLGIGAILGMIFCAKIASIVAPAN